MKTIRNRKPTKEQMETLFGAKFEEVGKWLFSLKIKKEEFKQEYKFTGVTIDYLIETFVSYVFEISCWGTTTPFEDYLLNTWNMYADKESHTEYYEKDHKFNDII